MRRDRFILPPDECMRAYRRIGVGCGLGAPVFVPTKNLVVDPGFEALGIPAWTAGGGATVTRQPGTRPGGSGSFCVRVAGAACWALPTAANVTNGKFYWIGGWVRSDGTGIPFLMNGALAPQWQGTNSASWQPFSALVNPGSTKAPILYSAVGGYTEWDDVYVYA